MLNAQCSMLKEASGWALGMAHCALEALGIVH
jgi:hypothetical protein